MSYDVEGMILAGEAIRPFCAPAAAAPMAPPRAALSASDLRAALVGGTFQLDFARMTIEPGGVATIESSSDLDVGRWQLTDDSQFCRTWNVWDRGRPRCYRLYREGETFALHAVDRWGVVKLRRMNP